MNSLSKVFSSDLVQTGKTDETNLVAGGGDGIGFAGFVGFRSDKQRKCQQYSMRR